LLGFFSNSSQTNRRNGHYRTCRIVEKKANRKRYLWHW